MIGKFWIERIFIMAAACLLDLILGDPYRMPHPIRLIGRLIAGLEKWLRKYFGGRENVAGTILVFLVLAVGTGIPAGILIFCYRWNRWIGFCVEAVFCYYLLAGRCLQKESIKVYQALKNGEIEEARKAVSMIVGRDTAPLDEWGITKAAVETVAENTSDGVIAPMFYMWIGGASFGFFYKAANTMDSMVGYQNERYQKFGRAAAKLDDYLNFVPSRLSAWLMIASARLLGLDAKGAYRIWKRDRFCHASPNSAQTESACAGALQVQLAGDAWYFGKLCKKPTIGDDIRPMEHQDIKRANQLMYAASGLMFLLGAIGCVWMAVC